MVDLLVKDLLILSKLATEDKQNLLFIILLIIKNHIVNKCVNASARTVLSVNIGMNKDNKSINKSYKIKITKF